MFSPTFHFSDPPFVHKGVLGYFQHQSQLAYCMLEYDSKSFKDDLFAIAGLPLPVVLSEAGVKRKSEYFAGRYCCSVLLRQHRVHSPIVGASRGVPVWPAGWRGSLSHTRSHAIAVLVKETSGLHPGVDIEKHNPTLLLNTSDMFTSMEEQAFLRTLSLPYSQALLLVFSAKETLFKALWPEIKGFIDFSSSYLSEVNTDRKTFTLTLTHTINNTLYAGKNFTGHYSFFTDNIVTCIS
ncbi:4'-phosphopantetheinyl transferase [Pantoea sp. paga]|uniref:4'-phosphopantetheinyl transferase family protein n=1 Tax=Pantoea sp. paga TaxID=2597519 RepID=UPI00117F97DB|nr:4'-phosphopantetheinyl transferase superfamily protein [Pantoea sp. paga]TSH83690.1 4'-phosphopantetheinyl transferase superfamily protein [Pantoea sp. paga]